MGSFLPLLCGEAFLHTPSLDLLGTVPFLRGHNGREITKKNEAVGEAYLAKAVQEKNLLYLSFYLHAYEGKINSRVYSFHRRNGMDAYNPALFLDMKLALQEVILKKLPTFDPTKGAKFLTYMYEFIGDALTSFRMREECWTIDSLDIYKGIRRMAAIYNASGGNAQNVFCKSYSTFSIR